MAHPSISHHLVCLCCYWVEGIFKLAYFSFSFLLGQRWAQVYLKHGVCAQSYPTLWDSMDYSLLDSPIPGIFQVSTLKWVAISSSRGSSQPWKSNPSLLHLLHWQADSLLWTTREALFETWYNLNISFPSILNRNWIAFYPLGLTLWGTIIKINYNLIGHGMKIDFSYNATVCNYQWCSFCQRSVKWGKKHLHKWLHLVGVLVLKGWVKCSEITRDKVINCALEIQYLHKRLRIEHYSLNPGEGKQWVKSVLNYGSIRFE